LLLPSAQVVLFSFQRANHSAFLTAGL